MTANRGFTLKVLFGSDGQVSFSFTYVGKALVTRATELIYDFGHQIQRGAVFQREIVPYSESLIDNASIYVHRLGEFRNYSFEVT